MRRRLLGAALLAAGFPALAQVAPIPWHPKVGPPAPAAAGPEPAAAPDAPPRAALTFDSVQTPEPGVYLARGNVRFTYPGLVLTCDALTYDGDKGTLWATGQVSVDFGALTLSGSELHYDLRRGTGSMRDAYGSEKSGLYVLRGREIKKTGEGWYEVVDGTFSSCNAAAPPWAIRVSKAKFHVDHYAFLHNPRFKVRSAPVFYLPYLVWPIKPERSTGLLFPQVGSSSTRGFTTSSALFLAPAEWWDDTVYLDTFETEGVGVGEELRYALRPETFGWFHGYYIRQRSDERKRWDFSWAHVGRSRGEWQSQADLNLVSDANFWRDYQRDYSKGTAPGTDSRAYLIRQWGPYSLNVRGERLRQFLTADAALTQLRLPGVEWRSALRPVGRGLYVGFQTSADALRKEWATWSGAAYATQRVSYGRFDLHPFAEWPLRTVPWLDVTPRLELRATGYTRSLDPATGLYNGGALWRRYGRFTLDLSGPRFHRRFRGGAKHVVEPFVQYAFASADNRAGEVPVFDLLDQSGTDQNYVNYGVRNRVYGRSGRLVMDSEVSQARSARGPLSRSAGESSAFSPVLLSLRAWPSKTVSADLRLRYNVLARAVDAQSLSLSAATADQRQSARVTYLSTRTLGASSTSGVPLPPARELSVAAALKLWSEKVTVDPVLERDLEARRWRNQRVVLWYRGSCFAVGLEAGRRQIGDFRDTEVRVLVSLKNVGNVVDLAAGGAGYTR